MNALTQLYSVDEIRTDKGTIRCHETVACQLIVRSSDDAQLICYNPSNVLDGLYSLSDLLKCKSWMGDNSLPRRRTDLQEPVLSLRFQNL